MLTVPIQAGAGASGLVCAHGAHHSLGPDATNDDHNADTRTHDHHGLETFDTYGGPARDNSVGSHHGPGECSSFSAAAIPAALPDFVRPDATLKVSVTVDPALIARAGDGLFRPPRTTTL